jgi:hypothetical protein
MRMCWVDLDVKDHMILFSGDLPVGERAAPSLGSGERLQLPADAGLRLVADFKKMTSASSAETASCRQSLPSPYPCGTVIRTQRAGHRQPDDLKAVSPLHRCMVPDDATRHQSMRCRPACGRPGPPERPPWWGVSPSHCLRTSEHGGLGGAMAPGPPSGAALYAAGSAAHQSSPPPGAGQTPPLGRKQAPPFVADDRSQVVQEGTDRRHRRDPRFSLRDERL